jgi:hypothetical protein
MVDTVLAASHEERVRAAAAKEEDDKRRWDMLQSIEYISLFFFVFCVCFCLSYEECVLLQRRKKMTSDGK